MTLVDFSVKGSLATMTLALLTTAASAQLAPGAYIVEFADNAVDAPTFFSNISSNAIDATPRLTLSHELFNGASFMLHGSHDNDTTIDTILQMDIVSNIWPVRLYNKPKTIMTPVLAGPPLAAALQKRTTVDTYTPHVMGGVDKLRAEGYTGEGVHIGIVDTGVDYNHPALGGGFGPGYKIAGGSDLVGNNYNGSNTPIPGPYPMDCQGHGTHVTGIIGANDNPLGFTGVVPNATLSMWKVFGCTGGVSTDVLIQAFNTAYESGVDVISVSIGGPSGWLEDALDAAVLRIAEKGTPVILAAGNSGEEGMFYTSSASESSGAISAASVNNIDIPALPIEANYSSNGNATLTSFSYYPGQLVGFATVSLPLFARSLDPGADGNDCNPFPAGTPSLSGFVVLLEKKRNCTVDSQIDNAAAFGAKNVLFYNNDASLPSSPITSNFVVPVGMVTAVQGATWLSQLKAGENITIDFVAVPLPLNPPGIGAPGAISEYTSWGPSFEGWIKPDVAAPGGLIVSTFPLSQGGYAIDSGTSMATPFIAGVAALIQQVRGQKTAPAQLRAILTSTANPLNWNNGFTTQNYLAPVIQQGGGIINAYKAAHSNTLVDQGNIALNDTANFQAAHPIAISNGGSESITYNFSNVLAATAYTFTGSKNPSFFPPSLNSSADAGATIRFDPPSLTLGSKESAQVVAHFTAPEGIDASRIPVYSGYVQINGTNGDSVLVPYGGIASRLKDADIFDPRFVPFSSASSSASEPFTTYQSFLLPGKAALTPDTIFPEVVYSLSLGTRNLRVDVVPEDLNGVPRIIGQQTIGSIPGFPQEYTQRGNYEMYPWYGQLADGTWAPEGNYTLLIRALRILGDADYDHDYQAIRSVSFGIKYQIQP